MMFPGLDRLQLTWRKPYAPILPWVAFVAGLCVLSYGIHALVLGAAEQEQVRLEADWLKARAQCGDGGQRQRGDTGEDQQRRYLSLRRSVFSVGGSHVSPLLPSAWLYSQRQGMTVWVPAPLSA